MLHQEAKSPRGHFWFAVVLEDVLVVNVVGVVLVVVVGVNVVGMVLVVVVGVNVVGMVLVVVVGVVLVASFICAEPAEEWLQVLQQIFE